MGYNPEKYRPPFFDEMRRSKGEICPRCGKTETTKKTGSFVRDNKLNVIWFCETCDKKYSYVQMIV